MISGILWALCSLGGFGHRYECWFRLACEEGDKSTDGHVALVRDNIVKWVCRAFHTECAVPENRIHLVCRTNN